MHVEAAQTHFLEHVDLMAELVLLQVAVPSPEGGSTVLGGRVLEEFPIQRGVLSVLFVEHKHLLFSA
jgi:hypothetical protein